MTNALAVLTNSIATAEQSKVTAPILKVCTAITPQFYKNKSTEELRAEALSIELLTQNIPPPVLGLMCKLALLNYPAARSQNEKVFFDINYILTFFTQAYNQCCAEEVNLDGYHYYGYTINRTTWTLEEEWQNDNGDIKVVRQVMDEHNKKQYAKGERVYSRRYWTEWRKENDARLANLSYEDL